MLTTLSLIAALALPGAGSTEASMDAACRSEIQDLHRFFQEWFLGTLDDTDQAFARFAGVMDEGFVIVSPAGDDVVLPELTRRLRAAHGTWSSDAGPGSRIWVKNVRVRSVGEGLVVAMYEEWQDVRGAVRGRMSSALFRRTPGTPNGVAWLHVHETWLPDDGP